MPLMTTGQDAARPQHRAGGAAATGFRVAQQAGSVADCRVLRCKRPRPQADRSDEFLLKAKKVSGLLTDCPDNVAALGPVDTTRTLPSSAFFCLLIGEQLTIAVLAHYPRPRAWTPVPIGWRVCASADSAN
jgi:hypothetical protein